MEQPTRAQIWATLKRIDVEPFCTEEVAGDLSLKYLPWMRAHQIMMGVYPEYVWEFTEDPQARECHYFDDGSAEVRCRMTIGGHTNITYLPVHRGGKAIKTPSAIDVNTAKQRCRVKALAEFGLGYKLWLDTTTAPKPAATEPPEQADEQSEAELVKQLWLSTGIEDCQTLSAAQKLHARYRKGLANRGWTDESGRWETLCNKKGWRTKK